MTRRFELSAILAANLLVAAGYIQQQAWDRTIACLVLAAFWLFFNLRRMTRTTTACFAILTGLAGLCMVGGDAPLLPFLGFMIGLAAWDLADFSARLDHLVPASVALRMEKLHLTRLAYTLGLALVAALAGLFINFQLSFITASILAILAFLALAFVVRELVKKGSDGS